MTKIDAGRLLANLIEINYQTAPYGIQQLAATQGTSLSWSARSIVRSLA